MSARVKCLTLGEVFLKWDVVYSPVQDPADNGRDVPKEDLPAGNVAL
jgi:hypothetical protein